MSITLQGIEIDDQAPILHCRSCGKTVWFGLTRAGKRCPFDVEEGGVHTAVSHFSTCNDPKRWTKR